MQSKPKLPNQSTVCFRLRLRRPASHRSSLNNAIIIFVASTFISTSKQKANAAVLSKAGVCLNRRCSLERNQSERIVLLRSSPPSLSPFFGRCFVGAAFQLSAGDHPARYGCHCIQIYPRACVKSVLYVVLHRRILGRML